MGESVQSNKSEQLIFEASQDSTFHTAPYSSALEEIDVGLRNLLEEAPSDASVKMVVRRIENGFRGFLRIRSSQKHFGIRARGSGLHEVVESLFDKVRMQLTNWKKNRVLSAHGWGE